MAAVFDNEQASPTEMQGRLRTVKKGQLKETRKAKLTKKPTAKLLLKQKMTARKLKEKFVDSELLPLLSSTDTKEHASGTAREGDKKSVAVTPAKRKKKGDPRSSSENGGKKKSRKNESRKSEGDPKSSSDNGNKKSRKIERAPKPKREKKHNSVMSGEAGGDTCSGDKDCADSSYNSTTPLLSARRASEKREKRIEARRLRRQKRKVRHDYCLQYLIIVCSCMLSVCSRCASTAGNRVTWCRTAHAPSRQEGAWPASASSVARGSTPPGHARWTPPVRPS